MIFEANKEFMENLSLQIDTLDQITGKVIDVSRTHFPLKALMIPLKRVKLRDVVLVNQCSNTIIMRRHSPQKCGLGSFFNIITS